MLYIVKRDNRKELFQVNKLIDAIGKVLDDAASNGDVNAIVSAVIDELKSHYSNCDDVYINVEQIHDIIERQLLNVGELNAAKAYVKYSEQRRIARESKTDLFKQFDIISGRGLGDSEFKRENANINADAPMGVMLKFGSESAKEYNLKHIIAPELAKLHENGDIHIHDLDFYHTFNCVTPETNIICKTGTSETQVSIKDMFPLLGPGSHKIKDIEILSKDGFTTLDWVHIRDADEIVYEFSTSNRELTCTAEHVLPVMREGRYTELRAKDILQSDRLLVHHDIHSWNDVDEDDDGTIVKIRKFHYQGKVYDLTTGDHYFIANNIVSHNCCQIPLGKLLQRGFSTGHGHIRQPQSISSAAAVACIILQSNQNDMFGGQSFPMWDYDLAPYVARSFIKHCQNICGILDIDLPVDFKEKCLDFYNTNCTLIESKEFLEALGINDAIYSKVLTATENECHQAMQAVIHNLNTMQSRCGSQTPFSSINYGTDTSPEGRMVVKAVLDETDVGLGEGETPIFPVQIFKCKKSVNGYGAPNHDLFKLACRVSAKRLFPNFSFLDSPYNAIYYKEGHPETEIAVMGCARGTETIVYRYNDTIYDESFIDAWNRLSNLGFEQIENGRSVYIKLKGVEILDRGNFVECKGILKNVNVNNWMVVAADNGRSLIVTDDHPLRVNDARTHVRDIKTGDMLYAN